MRNGPFPWPSESMMSVKRCVPTGNVSARRRRTSASVRASKLPQRVCRRPAAPNRVEDFLHSAHAQRHAGHQCAGVAPALRRESGSCDGKSPTPPRSPTPGGDQPRGRDDDALLEDVRGVGADRAGAQAADIGEMRPSHHEGAEHGAAEYRGEEHLVVAMRHRTAGAVAIVEPIQIPRLHAVPVGNRSSTGPATSPKIGTLEPTAKPSVGIE